MRGLVVVLGRVRVEGAFQGLGSQDNRVGAFETDQGECLGDGEPGRLVAITATGRFGGAQGLLPFPAVLVGGVGGG
ncbi:hypothetical protein ACFYVK_39775 [Streptomyces chartreusis]|uniref:hypothetical protein n=1 Tax=Streptomyces chartreusis TaxID=1969 RepID=UPI0036BAC43E